MLVELKQSPLLCCYANPQDNDYLQGQRCNGAKHDSVRVEERWRRGGEEMEERWRRDGGEMEERWRRAYAARVWVKELENGSAFKEEAKFSEGSSP